MENDIKQYESGKIKHPEGRTITSSMNEFRFLHDNNLITITTYIDNNTLYTLYSLDDTHLIFYPDSQMEDSFHTESFVTSVERPEHYLASAREKMIRMVCSLNPIQTNQAR